VKKMAQISLEVGKKQEQCVFEVEFPEFIPIKEIVVEKASFGKKLSKLVKSNVKEMRRIEDVKSMQNFRQHAIF
jgi:hypothetical protein